MNEKPMMARRIHAWRAGTVGQLFCVLMALLTCVGEARAVDRFDVFLGYDTYVPQASWFPIVCEIENTGPSFSGVVEVTGGTYSDGAKRLVPIELPTGTTKRITIPTFFDGSRGVGWNVRLLNSKGRVRAEQLNLRARQNVVPESILLGSISRNDVWSPSLQQVKVRQTGLPPVVARILPAIFPDNPIVLSGLDALYLNSERVAVLRLAQLDAVERWVRTGGHLIVGVESVSDVNSSRWLRGLVPARLSSVATVQAHSELQEWIRSSLAYGRVYGSRQASVDVGVGDPTEDRPFADQADDLGFETADLRVAVAETDGGRVLVAANGIPLIIQGAHGLGRVTVLTFSPEREPFRSWKSQPAMWSRLTEVPPRWHVSSDQQNHARWASDGIFGAMLDSRQIRKLPVGWLLLLLVAYLVVIGPLDRWWLKKIDKPMLTWITFPGYVLLFSGLIYLIGYKLRAGEREWNELHVVDVIASGNRTDLRGRTYGSLYSPVNDNYRLRGPQTLAAFRGEAANAWGGGGSSETVEVIQRAETFESVAYVPVWTSQLYVNDWWSEGSAPVRISFSEVWGGARCRLENSGEQSLTRLRLVWRGRVYELGDLAAGGTSQLDLSVQQGKPLQQFLTNLGAQQYQGTVAQRGRAFGGATSGRIDDLPNGSFVASFLGALPGQNAPSQFTAPPGTDLTAALRENAILLAWAEDQAAAAPMNQFRARRGKVHTLWRMAVPLTSNR